MVTRLLPSTNMTINTCSDKSFVNMRAQQEMINTQSCVTAISITEIIPKCVDLFGWIKFSNGICPSLRYQFFKSCTRLGSEQSIIHPSLWLIYILLVWHYIVI